MSIILTEVGQETRTAKAYFGSDEEPGEPLIFTYDPSKYTPLMEQRTQDALDKTLVGNVYASMLDGVITSWDAQDIHPDDKAAILEGTLSRETARLVPFPPTSENILMTPVRALVIINKAMQEDQVPSPKVSGNSSGSFGGEEK